MSNSKLSVWKRLVNIGFYDGISEEEKIQLRILNIQTLYCLIGGLAFSLKSIFQSYQDVLQSLLVTSLIGIILVLNYFQKQKIAKLYWTISIPLLVCGLIITYGNKPHGEILYLIPFVSAFILFDKKITRLILVVFVALVAIISLLHNIFYESPLAEYTDSTDSIGNLIISVVCIGSVIHIYTKALRHQLQVSEINNQALKDANTDLEHFTYMASHNLKTPLRTIMGNIFLMKRKVPKEQILTIQEHTTAIKESANDMHTLINDIMEYALFVKDEMQNVETINLFELTQNITKSVGVSQNKNVVCKYDGVKKINSNLTLIKAILQNLIDNGIKYNHSQNPKIEINVTSEKEYYLMKVTDNGIGISAEFHDKIFVMFKRLHHNDEYEGTGIGLAMCKRLLNKYGGEIWLKSEVEKGTIFFVKIPILN